MIYAVIFFAILICLTLSFFLFARSSKTERVKGRFAQLSEGKIYYTKDGRGDFVIGIHGLGATHHIWDPIKERLKDRYQFITLDLMGFGHSDKDLSLSYGLDDQARRVIEFLDFLGVKEAVLLGSSMGGALSLWLAKLYPERFKKVVVISPATQPKLIPRGLSLLAPMAPLARVTLNSLSMKLILRVIRTNRKTLTDDVVKTYLRPYREDSNTIKALFKATALITDYRLPNHLQGLRSDVLVIWPKKDRMVPFFVVENLCQILPSARLLIHEKGGHHLMEDDPDWLSERLVEFVGRSP